MQIMHGGMRNLRAKTVFFAGIDAKAPGTAGASSAYLE